MRDVHLAVKRSGAPEDRAFGEYSPLAKDRKRFGIPRGSFQSLCKQTVIERGKDVRGLRPYRASLSYT